MEIEPARSVAGDQAKRQAADQREERGHGRHPESDAASREHARENVTPELIGAEPVQLRRLEEAFLDVREIGRVGRQHICAKAPSR
jgi:hypothetical protein